jgi:hypothetical protein
MLDDQLFLFADEAVDHLTTALAKAKMVREIGRDRAQGKYLDLVQRKSARVLIHDLVTNCEDAKTAVQAARNELD